MAKIKFLFVLALIAALVYVALYYLQQPDGIKVIYLSGKAYLENSNKLVQVGDHIPDGVAVKLAEKAKCFLQMPGGGIIKLSTGASLKIQEQQIHLQSGTMAYDGRQASHSGAAAKVVTPQAELEVASKDFAVSVHRDRSVVSVYQGHINVNCAGKTRSLTNNQGAIVRQEDIATAALPAIVKIDVPKNGVVIEKAPILVQCQRSAAAASYHWECALDRKFRRIVLEEVLNHHQGRLTRPQKDASYFLRVRAINAQGVAGPPSPPVYFKLSLYEQLKKYQERAYNYYINNRHELVVRACEEGLEFCADDVKLLKYYGLSLLHRQLPDQAVKVTRRLRKIGNEAGDQAIREINLEMKKRYPDHR